MRFVVLSLLLLHSHTNTYAQNTFEDIFNTRQPGKGIDYNRKLLKDYAFCECMMHLYPNTNFKKDASTSLLLELGNYDYEAYRTIDSLTKDFVQSMPTVQLTEQKGMILFCIDYYNSEVLTGTILQLDKYLPKHQSKRKSLK